MGVAEASYDLVVIGGGVGGYAAAIRAAQLGMKAAVVERDKLGGTCLHRGCIPSKALLRTAEVLSTAREAAEYGVDTGPAALNLEQAMARKRRVVSQLHQGVEFLMKKHGVEVIPGVGRVMGPSIFSPQAGAVAVERDGDRMILTPRFLLIATGSRAKALPGLPFDGTRVISSDHALELSRLPASMLIVGAGAIGVEWASMMADFGVRVTLVEALAQVLPQEDEAVSRELARLLKKRGVRVMTRVRVLTETADVTEEGVAVDVVQEESGARERVAAEVVLVAVGREPVTDGLGLEATEVRVNRGAVVVDEHYRTAEPNIFAVGDVIGGLQLAHVAMHEGIHAVEVMAGRTPKPIDYTMMPRCTYSRPEVASVGLTEAEARSRGCEVVCGQFSFKANGKALVYGAPEGFVKVVADRDTDDVLGVHMIGPRVTDLIAEGALARVLNATPWEMAHTVHPHPTLAEALGEAALAVDGIAIHG
ncbi:dihydrolipoyl dehydrogenase [Alicyclobacillus sp.]|uniref:dihydrolipoyl dehydrogenase n=1 Tax=Alicyclobacillus sp. TaxID=61169 RepID=UPI0025B87887|nr:dihydrolipoyl dehydrogenase [Alicyclobacillus sp.]MCL6515791.1 dihydrolipoyl dehydrogenase [Alicyclobacillus sp.]